MKNLVTCEYINWLQKFRTSNATSKSSVQLSTQLIADLKQIKSIDALSGLMARHIHLPNEDSIHQYIPTGFYGTLSGWQDSISKLNGECDTALAILQNLSLTSQNTDLIQLLTELFTDKKARLNYRIASILPILRNENLSELIHYITTLPAKPYPASPRAGDFAAIQPVNDYHKSCLGMLNNLALSPSIHPFWNPGNGLLQSSLLIYLDMHMEEISLDDEEEFITPPEPSGCTLL